MQTQTITPHSSIKQEKFSVMPQAKINTSQPQFVKQANQLSENNNFMSYTNPKLAKFQTTKPHNVTHQAR